MANAKTAVNTAEMNIFQKLALIRAEFRAAGVQKGGKNIKQSYEFFELDDIIPTAEPILLKYHTMYITTIDRRENGDFALGRFLDTDNPDLQIFFEFPMSHTISINPPNTVMNEMQATGAEITYIRRYLYQLLLDITVADDIDSGANERSKAQNGTSSVAVPKKPTVAAPSAKREEIAKQITAPEAQADEMQIKALKSFLSKLMSVAPHEEDFVQTIVLKTDGFKNLTKSDCEGIINAVAGMITEYTKGENMNGSEEESAE